MPPKEGQNGRARTAEQLAIGLGWFSIGLGLAELLAADRVARLAGLPRDEGTATTLRVMGAREMGNGVAILANPASPGRVWARVGGDAIDLGVLATALGSSPGDRSRLLGAVATVAGVTLLDIMTARGLHGQNGAAQSQSSGIRKSWASGESVQIEKAVTVNRSIDEVYSYWRNLENLPSFMRHLDSVKVLGGRRSRWRAAAPAGMSVEWEAEVVQDRENEWIAWRSVEGSGIENSGSVRFTPAPGARGTEVRVQLQYRPPAGSLGRAVARMFGEEPEQQITEDLRRFKQLLETGEIPVSDGPGLWRAARPPKDGGKKMKALAGVHS
jgi:uncharacterized membrane protein